MFGLKIITTAQYNELMALAKPIVGTDVDRAVIALKNTPIGTAVANSIQAMSSTTKTGAEKFEAVVTRILPLIVGYITKGGVGADIKDVEDIGRALVQAVYNSIKSTTAGRIATLILRILGLGK